MNSIWILGFLAAATIQGAVIDDFEDGTTQNWVVGLLGAPSPVPPANVTDGGPSGAGDNYMQLTSLGGAGAGSRLVAINLSQWAGNYTSLGFTSISMDLRNLGDTDLSIRGYDGVHPLTADRARLFIPHSRPTALPSIEISPVSFPPLSLSPFSC